MIPEVRQKYVSNCIHSFHLTLPRHFDPGTEFTRPVGTHTEWIRLAKLPAILPVHLSSLLL